MCPQRSSSSNSIESIRTRGIKSSCICAKNTLALLCFLCPMLVTSAFLTPPYYSSSGLFANNNNNADADDNAVVVLPTAKVHLLEGKLLMKLPGQPDLEQAQRHQPFGVDDDAEEEDNICTKVSHPNATLVHSISKSTGTVVHLQPHSQFPVVFCKQQQPTQEHQQHKHQTLNRKQQLELQEEQCAVGGQCASIYRWVRHPHPRHQLAGGYVPDQVLIPVDCLCVLAYKEKFGADEPIVLE